MSVTPVIKIGDTAIRRRAPRLAGDMRRAQIIDAACKFFAEHGFSGPTRDLAASIGVTQALLYRYFDSKTDLIDAVFAAVFRGAWGEDALELFQAGANDRPTADRIADVYGAILPRMTSTATQLLFRAGLDAYAGPIHRNASMSGEFCAAVIDAWRAEESLPALSAVPMLEGERALVCSMHGSMLMVRVREHVLHVASSLGDVDQIRQIAEIHAAGGRVVLRRLHAGEASAERCAPAGAVALEEAA